MDNPDEIRQEITLNGETGVLVITSGDASAFTANLRILEGKEQLTIDFFYREIQALRLKQYANTINSSANAPIASEDSEWIKMVKTLTIAEKASIPPEWWVWDSSGFSYYLEIKDSVKLFNFIANCMKLLIPTNLLEETEKTIEVEAEEIKSSPPKKTRRRK